MSLQLGGFWYSSACHSIPVTQVFQNVHLSSGLLIRGFGVQVPGGAPVVTWGFITPGHFLCARFLPVVAPWLLARTPPAIRICQNGPSGARGGGIRPGAAPSRTAGAAPGSLDQWSRPITQEPGTHPEPPMPMSSHSVRPAGNRHSRGGYFASADASSTPATCQGCAGQRQGASRWRCRPPSALEAVNPLGTLDRQAGAMTAVAGPVHGTTGLPAPGTVAPARGLCAPGTAHGPAPLAAGYWGTLARSARGHSFRAAAWLLQETARDGPR
jgi:hypothetical protein